MVKDRLTILMIALVQQWKKIVLTLLKQIHNFLWVYITMMMKVICMWTKPTEIWKFKVHGKIPWYKFCLGTVSKIFTKDEMSQIWLNGTV